MNSLLDIMLRGRSHPLGVGGAFDEAGSAATRLETRTNGVCRWCECQISLVLIVVLSPLWVLRDLQWLVGTLTRGESKCGVVYAV